MDRAVLLLIIFVLCIQIYLNKRKEKEQEKRRQRYAAIQKRCLKKLEWLMQHNGDNAGFLEQEILCYLIDYHTDLLRDGRSTKVMEKRINKAVLEKFPELFAEEKQETY